MASVMVLQVLHDYSDAETAEAARCDLRWKAACGFPLDHGGFDPSTLVYWRRRLARSRRPHRVNDAVREVIGQTGVLAGRRRRAVDSSIVADAVATQDTVTQLVSAIRRVARLQPPRHACQAAGSGKSDHAAGPKGPGLPPHRRPCRRSSRPRPSLIQGPPRRSRRASRPTSLRPRTPSRGCFQPASAQFSEFLTGFYGCGRRACNGTRAITCAWPAS